MRATLAMTLVFAVSATAQEPGDGPPPDVPAAETGERREASAPLDPPTRGRVRASAPAPPSSRTLDRAPTTPDPWRGARAIRTEDGEAVVSFDGAERTVRPGDRLGDAVVREVAEGLVVLEREAVVGRPGGSAWLVVRFDAAGNPRVLTVHEEDPTRLEPTVVR